MKKVFLTAALSLLIFSKIFPQWTQQTSGVNNPLNSIFFIDENTGWASEWNGLIVKITNGVTHHAGSYEVIFNTSSFAGAIYIYSITAGSFSKSMKMII